MKHRFTQKMRARRDSREFRKAYVTASPSMQQELLVMASRQNFVR
jgi:hypothetical protein